MKPMIEYESLEKANRPFFAEFEAAAKEVIEKGWYILGENVKAFEREFAAYHAVKHCIGVASGLDALILSLMVYDFKASSEIIVPSNTYIASILAIIRAGLKPVLVEPDINTYNIDPQRIEEKITTDTVAIMAVHLYGKVCDMEPIGTVAQKYGLKIIEDCAQAHGAKYKNRQAGTLGDMGAFSFYPTKNLGALGDGGAILTNDDSLAVKLRSLRNYGSGKKYINDYLGMNSRLDEIQAAFLHIKLKHLDQINRHKRKLAALYFDGLDKRFVLPVVNDDYFDVFHIFAIRSPERDKLKAYLLENDIKTEIHYPLPPHKQQALRNFDLGDYPVSTEIHNTILSLPISFGTTKQEVKRTIRVMNAFYD